MEVPRGKQLLPDERLTWEDELQGERQEGEMGVRAR